jgi:hypothetical protein
MTYKSYRSHRRKPDFVQQLLSSLNAMSTGALPVLEAVHLPPLDQSNKKAHALLHVLLKAVKVVLIASVEADDLV